jgi:ABC-type amino acid transport system permease subunit
VYDVLVRYGVQDKVQAITTDNASNNGTAVSYLHSFVRGTTITYHISCLAYVLQLSLEAMLATLKASPAIEKEVEVWNDDLVSAVRQQTGFAHVIEKVSRVIPSPLIVIIFFFPLEYSVQYS